MSRILCFFLSILFTISVFSQTTKPKSVKPKTSVASKPVVSQTKPLKDLCDSASYTAGIHVVNRYRPQNVYNFNSAMVARAVNDMQGNKPLLIPSEEANRAVLAYQELLKTNPKPVFRSSPGVLKNLRDSASYAAGVYIVSFFRDFEIVNFNSAAISKAIDDLQNNKQPLLRDSLANIVAMRYQAKLLEVKNKTTIEAGKKFLDENKKRPGVKVTGSGLQYEVVKEGSGPKPTSSDKVSVHYTGSFIDGTEFNNSYTMGGPISFDVTGVIKGWTEALQMMPVGSKWKLYVPYQLGYGPGKYQAIPGGSTLVFEIDLLSIVAK